MTAENKKPRTKKKILLSALDLFSKKGYEGVSVKEIAETVGIRDASLYKHYKSKRAIFDAIVDEMDARMRGLSDALDLPGDDASESFARFGTLTEDALLALSHRIFLFYLKDPFVSRYRRMLAIEQYHSSDLSRMYREFFLEAAIQYQSGVFAQMVDRGVFIPAPPRVIAINFYAPIYYLLCRYDGQPDKEEEALALLDAQIKEFSRIYKKNGGPSEAK